jgi:carbonic anhydrase
MRAAEGVRWFVMKRPAMAFKAQINQFSQLWVLLTAPMQPVNARAVLK